MSAELWRWAAMIGLALFGSPLPSAAAEKNAPRAALVQRAGVKLEVEPSNDCMPPRELGHAVEGVLGRRVFVRTAATHRVRLRRMRAGSGWSAVILLDTHDGHTIGSRRIVSAEPDCRALDEALVLVLSLMLDLPEER